MTRGRRKGAQERFRCKIGKEKQKKIGQNRDSK